jgi:ribonuclease BN (tRNA processing enzyme)
VTAIDPGRASEAALTVLGCGGTYAAPDNACSGYLIEGAGTRLWVDTGPGTLANLQRHAALGDIDAIVLSHEHPDHWLDLPVVRNVLRYILDEETIPVYGTAGVRAMAQSLFGGHLGPTLDWSTITEGDLVTIGSIDISFSRTDHPVETLAMRFEIGSTSLVYTADTGPGWEVGALGASPDVVLCEATLDDADSGQVPHLTGGEAGATAAAAGAGRLLLTHLLPGSDPDRRLSEAAAEFDGPMDLVITNRRYSL